MKRAKIVGLCVVAAMAAGLLSMACKKSSSSGGSGGAQTGGQAVTQVVSMLGYQALAVTHGKIADGKVKPLGTVPIADYTVPCTSGHISVHSSANETTSGGGGFSVSGNVVATFNSCVVMGEAIAGGWTETFNITGAIVGTQVTVNGTVAVPNSTVNLSGDGFTGSCTVEQTVTFSNLKFDTNTLTVSGTVTGSGSACGYTHNVTCDMSTGTCQ